MLSKVVHEANASNYFLHTVSESPYRSIIITIPNNRLALINEALNKEVNIMLNKTALYLLTFEDNVSVKLDPNHTNYLLEWWWNKKHKHYQYFVVPSIKWFADHIYDPILNHVNYVNDEYVLYQKPDNKEVSIVPKIDLIPITEFCEFATTIDIY